MKSCTALGLIVYGVWIKVSWVVGVYSSLAAISQTTTHMHGHHEATMGLAGVSLGRELRALALSHTASVRRGTA
jgi:hypothetical protein